MRFLAILFILISLCYTTTSGDTNTCRDVAKFDEVQHLRCCYMNEKPISYTDSSQVNSISDIKGVIAEYVPTLQKCSRWTCGDIKPYQGTGTNYNGFVDEMNHCADHSNCTCDIGIGGWFQTPNRYAKVHFIPPYAYDRYRVFTHVDNTTYGNDFFFFVSFSPFVWLTISGIVLLFALSKMADWQYALPETKKPEEHSWDFRRKKFAHGFLYLHHAKRAFQSTVNRMLLQSDDELVMDKEKKNNNRKSAFQAVLNILLSIFALFIILTYEASMTSSILNENIKSDYQSIESFTACDIKPSDVCFVGNEAFETIWDAFIKPKQLVNSRCHTENRNEDDFKESTLINETKVDSYEDLFAKIESRYCRYGVAFEAGGNAVMKDMKYCKKIVAQGQPLFERGVSMLLPRGSKYEDKISKATLQLKVNRETQYMAEYLEKNPICRPIGSRLSFEDLRGFFIVSYTVAGILFLIVIFYPPKATRTMKRNKSHAEVLVQKASECCFEKADSSTDMSTVADSTDELL